MDHHQVLRARENRKTRLARPFENFYESFEQCINGGWARLRGEFPPEFTLLLERSIIISAVTAVEVYYRDMLDAIFRYCTPTFLEPKLKHLHPEKYDIIDVLNIYMHKIHPVELISSNQSFHNVEKIDKIFSKFTDKGFWTSVLELKACIGKLEPEKAATWTNDDFEGLKAIFNLRHELVHDPARRAFFNYEVVQDLGKSMHMVFGSDLILCKVITDNMRASLKDKQEESHIEDK